MVVMNPKRSGSGRQSREESDPRLFRLRRRGHTLKEIPTHTVAMERSLQRLMERHLLQLLDVHFVASEHPIGAKQTGRIDTLGLDMRGAPVVIEYKRTLSVNLISQGLYYLDWLQEHRAEFRMLVQDRLGVSMAGSVQWGEPRVICVASDFHRYDVRAVRQIGRRIELVRYFWFGEDLLFLAKIAIR
jgi:hypothetical protein